MTLLGDRVQNKFVKILLVGDSGSGKTSSLVSLINAGYDLKILEYDSGLDALEVQILKHCPDKINSVDYEYCGDEFYASPAGPQVKKAVAFARGMQLLTKWTDDTRPCEWGPKTVLVVDSFTRVGRAAYNWAQRFEPGLKDNRQYYNLAQEACEKLLSMVMSDSFQTNVIVITHLRLQKNADGDEKLYPTSIGQSFNNNMASYVNSMVLAQRKKVGSTDKYSLVTAPTAMLDLKIPNPDIIEKTLPLETGLAQIFEKLKVQTDG